ncbi:MAG: hypothetical protein ACRBK7_27225 [Acidimicrobiales bacterium]
MSRIPIAVLLIGSGLFAAGCANRPTAADLTESIVEAAENDPTVAITLEEAQCIAAQLLSTDLSDTTMSGLAANFNEPEVLSAEQSKVTPAVTDAARECVGNS